ncbi:MAG: restriction endonuclease [Flavobacteriales bacterium]|nr:restriction endonuclease [Flavobacteriales bacterium]
MASRVITVFEHERLVVGEAYGKDGVRFSEEHFNALVRYNEQHESRFFTVEHHKIKFTQHVGVIAVRGLTIEVLPKADGEGDEAKWQHALIDMLKVAHGLPLHEAGHARLALRRTSVLEYFLRLFVDEVQRIVRQGLVKRYHGRIGVKNALKGRLNLPQHIAGSIIHKERFHVVHQVYDTDHLLHAILKKALKIVEDVTRDPITMGLAQDVGWAFETVQERRISGKVFDKLVLDRKTGGYADALQLARLILLNYAPDIRGGREHILSLLFDMNRLFEVVVLKLLQRATNAHPELTVTGQNSREFWNGQRIRPDILVTRDGCPELIIDTKWKLPKDGRPADADLKQMYAYNLQFGAVRSMLLYPGHERNDMPHTDFVRGAVVDHHHGCALRYVELFDSDGRIWKDAGAALLKRCMDREKPSATHHHP